MDFRLTEEQELILSSIREMIARDFSEEYFKKCDLNYEYPTEFMQSRTIVAVNKDKNAPVFSQCDYGLVGDLYKVLPALTKLMA